LCENAFQNPCSQLLTYQHQLLNLASQALLLAVQRLQFVAADENVGCISNGLSPGGHLHHLLLMLLADETGLHQPVAEERHQQKTLFRSVVGNTRLQTAMQIPEALCCDYYVHRASASHHGKSSTA
jgi:hypothetical protein